jgi:hypothetical protein
MELDFGQAHDLNDQDYHEDVNENDRNYFENLAPELGDDDENYTKKVDEYLQMLQETCDVLSQIDGGYRGKLERFIKKRNEDSALYREVSKVPIPGNLDGDLTEIQKLTSERRWRATSAVQGPAWKRYLERNPPTKIRGLTEREQAIVNKNMKDRALWGKIM